MIGIAKKAQELNIYFIPEGFVLDEISVDIDTTEPNPTEPDQQNLKITGL